MRRPSVVPGTEDDEIYELARARARDLLEKNEAPPSLILHYLREGSEKAKLEKEILKGKAALQDAQTKALKESADLLDITKEAIQAFQGYGGNNLV